MKKQFQLFAIFALVLSIGFTSCGSDDGDEEPSKSTSEELTSGSWKTTAMTIDPGISFGGVVVTDFFAQIPPCSQDDLITFNSNGTITDDEGATKCSPTDPQTTTDGTWALSSDNKVLTIDDPEDDPISVTITSISSSTFVGTYIMEEDFGAGMVTYTVTITMNK